jgi:hypothetical protein
LSFDCTATFRCPASIWPTMMEYSRVYFVTRNWDAWLTIIEHSRLCLNPIQASIKWPLIFHSWSLPRVLSMLAHPAVHMLILLYYPAPWTLTVGPQATPPWNLVYIPKLGNMGCLWEVLFAEGPWDGQCLGGVILGPTVSIQKGGYSTVLYF